MSEHPGIIRHHQENPEKKPGILQTIHWVTNVHSVGFSWSIGLWLSYHKLPIWECLQNGVPQTFFFHLKKVWGTHVGTPILRHPHMFSTGHPHMSEHPGIIRHHQETPRDSSNHSLGHQCSLSGSIGLWLSYHKLPICLPQVTHICQTTQGKLGITRKHLGILQTMHWVTNVHSVGPLVFG